jgi:hypothetical protein
LDGGAGVGAGPHAVNAASPAVAASNRKTRFFI